MKTAWVCLRHMLEPCPTSTSTLPDSCLIVVWHNFSDPIGRLLSAKLPIGYVYEGEVRKGGMMMPPIDASPANTAE